MLRCPAGDDPEVVQEAIDTCPVMCISYVDLEDLVTLESEREGQVIMAASIGVPATWSVRMNALPPTEAKAFNGKGGTLATCNNCPSRGCKECPMYGVGMNPVYLELMADRQRKKELSGEAQQEMDDAAKEEQIGILFGAANQLADGAEDADTAADDTMRGVVEPTMQPATAAGVLYETLYEPTDSFFDVLYGGMGGETSGEALGEEVSAPASVVESPAEQRQRAAAEARAESEEAARVEAVQLVRRLEAEREEAEREEAERVEAERAETARQEAARLAAAEAELATRLQQGGEDTRRIDEISRAVDAAEAAGVCGAPIDEARAALRQLEARAARERAETQLVMALRRATSQPEVVSELIGLELVIEAVEAAGLLDESKLRVARDVLASKGRVPRPEDRWW